MFQREKSFGNFLKHTLSWLYWSVNWYQTRIKLLNWNADYLLESWHATLTWKIRKRLFDNLVAKQCITTWRAVANALPVPALYWPFDIFLLASIACPIDHHQSSIHRNIALWTIGSFSWLRSPENRQKMSAFDTVRGFDLSLAQTFGKPIEKCSKVFKNNTGLWFGVKTHKLSMILCSSW